MPFPPRGLLTEDSVPRRWNSAGFRWGEGGPDFRGARLVLGAGACGADVEITGTPSGGVAQRAPPGRRVRVGGACTWCAARPLRRGRRGSAASGARALPARTLPPPPPAGTEDWMPWSGMVRGAAVADGRAARIAIRRRVLYRGSWWGSATSTTRRRWPNWGGVSRGPAAVWARPSSRRRCVRRRGSLPRPLWSCGTASANLPCRRLAGAARLPRGGAGRGLAAGARGASVIGRR